MTVTVRANGITKVYEANRQSGLRNRKERRKINPMNGIGNRDERKLCQSI